MKNLIFLISILLPLSVFGQSQGVSQRATNGTAFGEMTVAGHINATNSSQTNTFAGKFQQGTGKATALGAAAFGNATIAFGQNSVAIGSRGQNGGTSALSAGISNTITSGGAASFIFGSDNFVAGSVSAALGTNNFIEGFNDFGIGDGNSIEAGGGGDVNNHIILLGRGIDILAPSAEVSSNLIVLNVDPAGFELIPPQSNSIYLNAPGGVFINGQTTFSQSNQYFGNFIGNGVGLTNIAATNVIGRATIASAQTNYTERVENTNTSTLTLAGGGATLLLTSSAINGLGAPGGFYGLGANLTGLTAANLTPGGTLSPLDAHNLTNLDAGSIASGTLTNAINSSNATLTGPITVYGNVFRTNSFRYDSSGWADSNASGTVVINGGAVNATAGFVASGGNFTGNGSGLTNLSPTAQLTSIVTNEIIWDTNCIIVSVGDSLSGDARGTNLNYAHWFTNRFPQYAFRQWTNTSHSGWNLQDVNNDYPTSVRPLTNLTARTRYLILWVGANDSGSARTNTAAQWNGIHSNYVVTAKADGWTVIGVSIIPAYNSTTNSYLLESNAVWRASVNSYLASTAPIDAFVDLRSIIRDPFDNAAFSGQNPVPGFYDYPDGVHLNTNGQDMVACQLERAIRFASQRRQVTQVGEIVGTNLFFRTVSGKAAITVLDTAAATNAVYVGIGTNAPTAALDVQHAVNDGAAGLRVKSGFASTDRIVEFSDGTDPATTGKSTFVVTEPGFTGIGTNAPKARLHLVEIASVNNLPFILQVSAAHATNAFELWRGANAATTNMFNISPAGNVSAAGVVSATNGYFMPSNALSVWPTAPRNPGDAYWGNSNGTIYLLQSALGATWTSTNKIGQ